MSIFKPSRGARLLSTLAVLCTAMLVQVAPASAEGQFGFDFFDVTTLNAAAEPETQAGAHPATNTTRIHFARDAEEWVFEHVRSTTTDLPPGLIGAPTAVEECPISDFRSVNCPIASQVGLVSIELPTIRGEPATTVTKPLNNLVPNRGTAAQFGFLFTGVAVVLTARIRPDDYGVRFTSSNVTETAFTNKFSVLVWGVPGDPIHDTQRAPNLDCEGDATVPGSPDEAACQGFNNPIGIPIKPFLSNPQDCTSGPLLTTLSGTSWESPTDLKTAAVLSHDDAEPPNPVGTTGCDRVSFDPQVQARATTPLADSPSGLDVNLHVPQNEDPEGLSTAYMKKIVMDLPKGLTVNPSSANGLGACSPQQMGMTTAVGNPASRFDGTPVTCPDSSRLGTVESVSPAVDHPLPGSIYLAQQGNNPFDSLLALYLVVDDPETGIRVKLAGKVETDPATGQLRTIFANNPQLPVEDLKVSLFTGPRAALRTPLACGTYASTADFTPWTSPEGANAVRKDSFAITQGAGGGACVSSESQAPNSPTLSAGTVDPTAGAYSPFVLKLTRADGTQPIKGIDTTLPKGLVGKLAGIPYCSDGDLAAAAGKSGRSEQASSSCPGASQVGSVTVGAGAGSLPLYVNGKAYLAGPYKGAPLSLAIVTPAVAGPFDLGTVVVRTALKVNPETAQINAVSDEFPTILQGIPLDIRSVAVNLDKPSFTLNPTSCAKTSVFASATSVFNQSASMTSPFQVGGCRALGFKPNLAFKLSGPTRRAAFPALRATLTARPGDANIGKAVVTLPKSQFLAQEHIKTICTRVQYAANACPAGSVYGKARAWTPLLDRPLEGPVYLRSSSNPLPDLVAKLDGQIHLDVVGRIDSYKSRLRSSFDAVPDAPVSKFVIEMQGGKKGLLVNNTNLCKAKPKADVKLDAQSGKTYDFNPAVKVDCKGKKSKKKKGVGKKKTKAPKGSRH